MFAMVGAAGDAPNPVVIFVGAVSSCNDVCDDRSSSTPPSPTTMAVGSMRISRPRSIVGLPPIVRGTLARRDQANALERTVRGTKIQTLKGSVSVARVTQLFGCQRIANETEAARSPTNAELSAARSRAGLPTLVIGATPA